MVSPSALVPAIWDGRRGPPRLAPVAPPQKPVATEAELFSWSGVDAADYWGLWLSNAKSDREIARAMAGHLALDLMPTIPDEASRLSSTE